MSEKIDLPLIRRKRGERYLSSTYLALREKEKTDLSHVKKITSCPAVTSYEAVFIYRIRI